MTKQRRQSKPLSGEFLLELDRYVRDTYRPEPEAAGAMASFAVEMCAEEPAVGEAFAAKPHVSEARVDAAKRRKKPVCFANVLPNLKEEREAFAFDMSCEAPTPEKSDLEKAVSELDESFSEMLLRKIDEKGLKDSECYKKAQVDRKLFSKIRSDRQYRPSKPTVIAFACALELSLPETREMLKKAGFALSGSNKFDVIVEFFLSRGHYDLFELNEALLRYDQPLINVS